VEHICLERLTTICSVMVALGKQVPI